MSQISKSKLNQLLSLSSSPKIDLVKENNQEYEISIKGKKDKMSKSTSNFELKILTELEKINSRLDNIEQDVKEIKNTPTMKKELKHK